MKKTQQILMTLFITTIISTLIPVLLFETGTIAEGPLEGNTQLEFTLSIVGILTAICSLPVALRLFRFKTIAKQLADSPQQLLTYGVIRIAMIATPMLTNTLFYYLFMRASFAYMAITCALCMCFITPTMKRCMQETAANEQETNNDSQQ